MKYLNSVPEIGVQICEYRSICGQFANILNILQWQSLLFHPREAFRILVSKVQDMISKIILRCHGCFNSSSIL